MDALAEKAWSEKGNEDLARSLRELLRVIQGNLPENLTVRVHLKPIPTNHQVGPPA